MKNILLAGGLDLTTPKTMVPPGSLEDCFNYEVGIQPGYQISGGFERFDGRMSPSTRDIWEITVPTASITGAFVANENITWTLGTASGNFGVVISRTVVGSDNVLRFAYWSADDLAPDTATLAGDTSGATFTYDLANHTLAALKSIATDADDYFDQLLAAAVVLRSAITVVPGTGPVSGIKWYKNQQHAVRDYFKFNFITGDVVEPQLGQHVLIGGDSAPAQAGFGDEGIVRNLTTTSGSFSTSNGVGTIEVEPVNVSFSFDQEIDAGLANDIWPLVELYFTSGSIEPTFGQVLQGQTSGKQAYVYRVDLQSGAWADGDAAGVIYSYDINGTFTPGELIDRVSPSSTNIMTLDIVLFANFGAGSLKYSTVNHTVHDRAGLYKTSRTGWQKIELGWELRFNTGTNEPTAVQFGADTSSQPVSTTAWAVAATQRDLTGWAASAGTEIDAVGISAGAYVNPDSDIGSSAVRESEFFFAVHNFGISLPRGARVVGVEIEITAKNTAAATSDGALMKIQPFLNNTASFEGGFLARIEPKRQAMGDLTTALVAYSFGGENDLWGASITKDTVEDVNFGIKFKAEWAATAASTTQQCDYIRLRVHYVEQGSALYFYDTVAAADYTQARLIHFHVESGAFSSNDAAGILHVYELLKGQMPTKNIQVRDAAAGAGNLIGNLIGSESRVSLPGSAAVQDNNAKYQLIAENVYARDDLESIYGVSGAGPAFSYDGFYVRFARTGLSPELDKPRHVALFQYRLWLAYGFGEMAISVAGDPLSFDGTLNAVATGFGRPITGLVPLAGKTMGVLTDQSTHAVTVSGSDFDQQIFAPKVGAIEYTVQDAGVTPMYADARGVSTPATSDKYGDFEVGRLSHKAHPWLLPRLQGRATGSATRNQRVVAATVSRLKNQYRLYFADGYRLTMTLGTEVPQITRQYLYTDNIATQYIRVLATDSDVDDDGNDRMFFTMGINPDYDHGDDLGYVYEEDRGTSYDGSAYKRWLELSPFTSGNVIANKIWAAWHLYGMAHGYAALEMTTAVDFAHPTDPDSSTEDENYELALGATGNAVTTEPVAYWDKDRINTRGRALGIRIQNESNKELPHLLQNIILVDEKKARTER